MSAFRLRFVRRGTPTPTPTPTPSAIVTFDTSIGNGVGTDGFASLPLHAGAKYIYVNSSTGSNSNSGLTAALAKATLTAGVALITGGAGDQVLVAEGTTYTEAIDTHVGLNAKSGLSPVYPTVIQSYDPADSANTAKYGRATGSSRPKFTGTADSYFLTNSGTPTNYLAFRGLELNPGSVDGAACGALGTASGQHNYQIFENCRFFYTQLVWQMASAYASRGFKYIARNCSFYGQWSSTGNAQGIYSDFIDGMVVEDCIFWHNGWRVGAARGDSLASGGPTNLSHTIYAQDNTRNTVVRRCAMIDGAADGGRIKGGGLFQNNLALSNFIGCDNGGGNQYVIDAPLGVYHDIAGNFIAGGKSIDASTNGGWMIHTVNGKNGSSAHHNIGAYSTDPASAWAFMTDAKNENITDAASHPTWSPAPIAYATPDYTDWNYNVLYQWSVSGGTKVEGLSGTTDLTKIHATYNNNVWPDPTSGTNTNIGSVTLPNAYTITGLLSAINVSYTDLTTASTDWINNPDQRGWRTGIALAKTGYGVTQALTDLNGSLQFTIGIADSSLLIGTLDGSTLTAQTTMPTGYTLDSDGRCIRYDGTSTAATGSVTIRETDALSNTHDTVFTWTRSARPVLSSLTKTSSSTATISTDTSGGSMMWEVTPLSTTPDWTYIRVGLKADLSGTALAFGSQAVSASGSQTLTGLSNLTAGNYLHVAQLDANNNPSLTATLAL